MIIHEISNRLQALKPEVLEIIDESHLHANHRDISESGNFRLKIISAQFSGKSHIIRHRTVYQLLADLIPNKIHALSIDAIAPDEL